MGYLSIFQYKVFCFVGFPFEIFVLFYGFTLLNFLFNENELSLLQVSAPAPILSGSSIDFFSHMRLLNGLGSHRNDGLDSHRNDRLDGDVDERLETLK